MGSPLRVDITYLHQLFHAMFVNGHVVKLQRHAQLLDKTPELHAGHLNASDAVQLTLTLGHERGGVNGCDLDLQWPTDRREEET